jgi:hypothetical protein
MTSSTRGESNGLGGAEVMRGAAEAALAALAGGAVVKEQHDAMQMKGVRWVNTMRNLLRACTQIERRKRRKCTVRQAKQA